MAQGSSSCDSPTEERKVSLTLTSLKESPLTAEPREIDDSCCHTFNLEENITSNVEGTDLQAPFSTSDIGSSFEKEALPNEITATVAPQIAFAERKLEMSKLEARPPRLGGGSAVQEVIQAVQGVMIERQKYASGQGPSAISSSKGFSGTAVSEAHAPMSPGGRASARSSVLHTSGIGSASGIEQSRHPSGERAGFMCLPMTGRDSDVAEDDILKMHQVESKGLHYI